MASNTKFGRSYHLSIGKADGTLLIVTPPLTIEFDITRNTLSSANVCQVRIFNLALNNRNQIRFNASNYGELRPIELRAGYGDNLPIIFQGNISQAWSVREGTNFITTIECYDGGFAFGNATTDMQFPSGASQKTVIKTLASSLPGVSLGAIGNYSGTLGRGNSYSGSTTDLLRELTGGGFFVDQGRANALGNNEYIDQGGELLVIDSSSGLLNTPVLEQTIVRFDMIFEPALNVGTKIQLQSSTEANYNGYYKVIGVKHRGMISEAVCGECITTGEFFFTKILTPVQLAEASPFI